MGELTHLHEVSQTPSYASVDATLLFLIAIARHVLWTADPGMFEGLRGNVDRALAWLDRKSAENAAGSANCSASRRTGSPGVCTLAVPCCRMASIRWCCTAWPSAMPLCHCGSRGMVMARRHR